MKKASLVFFLLLPFVLSAQTQPEHPKKMYKDSQNRLYTHPSLPQYIFVSTDPNGKDMMRMESEQNKSITNPMHWDGHGVHNFKHQDLIEKANIVFEIYADGIAPITSADFGATPTFVQGGTRYYGVGLKVALSAKDEMSGVENTFYSLNGEAFKPYTATLVLDEEKSYSLKFYSLDHVGNAEAVKEFAFIVDKSTPKTSLAISGDRLEDVLSPRVTLSLTSQEGGAGTRTIFWKFDEQPEKPYLAPIPVAGLSQGEHTITYYSLDQVANKEGEQSYTFFLDNVAPIVSADVIGDRYEVNGKEYASGRTKIKLSALDNKAGVDGIFYRLNTEPYQLYTEPFYLPSRGGLTNVFAYAVDKARNSNQRDNEGRTIRALSVDLSGPTLRYDYTGPVFKTRDTTFVSKQTKIGLYGTDLESGLNRIGYSVNGSEEQAFTTPISFDKSGIYIIEYAGYDHVENRNVDKFFFRLDDKGPEIFPRLSIEALYSQKVEGADVDVYPAHVVLFFSSTDDLSGYDKLYYTINGGEEKLYINPVAGFEKGKNYVIGVRALDKLGNETKTTFRFSTEK